LDMTRDEIHARILKVFSDRFEIDNPGPDEELREVYEFDSIDAIELLREIELMLGTTLTLSQKKAAMHIRTIDQIIDYVAKLANGQAAK
jgi:acyl carrier protein